MAYEFRVSRSGEAKLLLTAMHILRRAVKIKLTVKPKDLSTKITY